MTPRSCIPGALCPYGLLVMASGVALILAGCSSSAPMLPAQSPTPVSASPLPVTTLPSPTAIQPEARLSPAVSLTPTPMGTPGPRLIQQLVATDRYYHWGIEAIDWSSDGSLLSASTSDGMVRVWAVPDWALEGELDLGRFVGVQALRWAPQEPQLAVGTDAMTVMIWAPTSHAPRRYMKEAWGVVLDVIWSPEATRLAAVTYSQTVRIWDAATGLTLFELPHGSIVTDLAWSPTANYIAVSTQGHGISLWEAATGQRVRYLVGTPGESVSALAWSPDGSVLAALEPRVGVFIWDTADWGSTLARPGPTGNYVEWRSDSSALLVTLRESYCILDPPIDPEPFCPSAPLQGTASIHWSPDGKELLVAPAWPAVHLLDLETLEEVAKFPYQVYVTQASLSPDGKYLAIGLMGGTIDVWTLAESSTD
jgi:WD40 repeat protein